MPLLWHTHLLQPTQSPDPKDDAFCICAEEGSADFIFTLNPKDFPQTRLKAKVIQPYPVQHFQHGDSGGPT
jgi:hypothetical protein